MKRWFCALLAILMLTGCVVLAESTEAPEEEIVALEEGDVSAAPVATPEAEAPAAEAPTTGAEDAGDAASDTVRIGFEDGFSVELPDGWLYHPTTEDMSRDGVIYCLSDADGAGWLYIQLWNTDCTELTDLKALIDRTTDIQTSGIYSFNGTNFVVYDLTEGDVSCCAALLNGKALNLVFTPQSDADFMAVAAQILNTFELL